jgi:putative addiction module component (TIGR02574 family)
MMRLRDGIGNLSTAEKFELLDALWASLEADELTLTKRQRDELEYCLRQYERNPGEVIPWEQVRAGLLTNSDAAGCLATGSGCRPEGRVRLVREHSS